MTSPPVLALVVTHDGEEWLPEVLDALEQQTYDELDVVAVDNASTDSCRDILRDRLGEARVLVSDEDLGFPAAVNLAFDAEVVATSPAKWVLLVHDDLVLEPDAIERLVEHGERDPGLAVIGPKLLRYDDPRILQQVGLGIDLTGRTDTGLEPDEHDQGQRDQVRRVLYASTAGMLVRRDVFRELGGFDARYHAMRDDLDLCWRAWLSGHAVEIEPAAVGRHVRAVSNFKRLGRTASPGPRYYAERNTLATLLKCYGPPRLALVLPLFFLVGVAKVLGFVATRRFGDAAQTVRAWGWNLGDARATLRLRRRVQGRRTRGDDDLGELFTRIVPRLRAYVEAMADWLAGDIGEAGVAIIAESAEEGDAAATEAAMPSGPGPLRFVARRPVAAVGLVLSLLVLIGGFSLLQAGDVHGGDFAPWPDSPRSFLSAYASAWNDAAGLGSPAPASPAEALLGVAHTLMFGNEWLASRLLLLGTLLVAWLAALRAGVLVTSERLPRLAGATAYALSPPALAAVATGDLGAMVTIVLLPLFVLVGARVLRLQASPGAAWQSTAAAALLAALVVAFEPPTALAILAAGGVALVVLAVRPGDPDARRGAALRVVAATVGAFVLLLPWSLTFVPPDSPIFTGFGERVATAASPFLEWVVLRPDLPGFPSVLAGVALVAGAALGLFVAFGRRPFVVGGLWAIALAGAGSAWLIGQQTIEISVWPALPLVLSAAAYAALVAVAFSDARRFLAEHEFGWRQIVTIGCAAAVVVGLVAGGGWLALNGWDAYRLADPVLPAFVTAEQDVEGPYRVLVLSEGDGAVVWDVTGPEGPRMTAFGAPYPDEFADLVNEAVTDVVAGVNPAAAARLGLANILYVYVPEGGRSDGLEAALGDQLDLEPQPVEAGLVYRVRRWVPRAAFVTARSALAEARKGELSPEAEPLAFSVVGDDRYVGSAPEVGTILLAEPSLRGWSASANGDELARRTSGGLIRFPVRDAAERVTVDFEGQRARTIAVGFQALLVVLALSLVLRPPGFAREEVP